MRCATALLAALLVVCCSGCAPRSAPEASFRQYTRPQRLCPPPVPGVHFHFPHLVRVEALTRNASGSREVHVVMQFRGPLLAVRTQLLSQLRSARFAHVSAPGWATDPGVSWFRRNGYGTAGVKVRPIPGTSDATPVDGYVELHLPLESLKQKSHRRCQSPLGLGGRKSETQ